jgi:uncharacterized protein (UPF0276 family)
VTPWTARPSVGIGLRQAHVAEVLARRPRHVWFEVHAENYMYDPRAAAALDRIRESSELALHGVALSLGSAEGLDADHLGRLKRLVDRWDPFLVSEHLAWSAVDGTYLNDLLPLPYTQESLDVLVSNVDRTQHELGRRILVENPSGYLRFRHSTLEEAAFLTDLARRTGCGVLCDINNIHVTAHNLQGCADEYLRALPAAALGEFHLAGHSVIHEGSQTLLIDDHGSAVSESVWELYRTALGRFGAHPTLIEWDNDLPSLDTLLEEAAKARRLIEESQSVPACG